MVWNWLRRAAGKKDTRKKESHHHAWEENSIHTMGPEELLSPEEMKENSFTEEEKYAPIPGMGKRNDKKLKTTGSKKDKRENISAVEENEEGISENTREDILRTMEACLFMKNKGTSIEELAKVAGIPFLTARTYVPELIESFNAKNTALEIAEDTGGFRMKVRSPYDEKVSHLAGTGELSPAEMKTLAFIAYKQPLIQSRLVQVRSNTAYDHLQTLVEKGFVSREPKGRTYVLRTTKKFSEYFGTHSLKVRPMTLEEKNPKPDHSAAEELS